jgi:predicted regulator of Ras-like GTPase activity (Roadblock/LC7/MglB family)
MLTFFKNLFGKKAVPARSAKPVAAAAAAAVSIATPRVALDSSGQRAQVAVAQLSLAAIISKFPEELKRNVARVPDPSVTVALPLTTIHKQLAAGSVKMSLASLYRQAPPGTFTQARVEDKRMVEVPLSEVFRHVDAQALRRRGDQRRVVVPRSAPQLFGDKQNPRLVAPSADEDEEMIPPPAEIPRAAGLQMTPESSGSFPAVSVPPAAKPRPAVAAAPPQAPAPAPAPAVPVNGVLSLPLAQLWANWPDPIRSEAANLPPETQVTLPADALAVGLAKGKVAFSWGQIRSWIVPALNTRTDGREHTELVLPLKIVAPAFLALTRPQGGRRAITLDESIPALFAGNNPPPAPAPPAPVEPPPAAHTLAPPAGLRLAGEPAVQPEVEAEAAPAPEAPVAPPPALAFEPPAPAAPTEEPHHAHGKAPTTLGELFGQPERAHWSPQEIIDRTAQLSGVAGAALALQEGLLIAARLPEEMKGDTVAAFLPQIFARLNIYAGEMKLGQVEDILVTTNGSHFQAYRLGELYFAVLGRQGEALPWEALRLVVQELAAQAPK